VAEARERPQSINEIMASTTGLKVKGQLAEKCSDLQTHLTSLGFTACHQYFRRMWVPKLGPALAWLIIVLRSRCFYRAETDELRDQATWRKGELAACLGQTTRNLSNLLTHADAELFFKILSQNKPSLTLKVEMVSEPLLADPATAVNEPIPVPINPKKDDNLSLPVAQKSDTTALEPKKVDSYHPEVENFLPPDPADRKKADPTKYLSNQPIPNQKIIPSLPIQLFNLSNGGNCHETK
jgi:hypothetical protein